MGHITYYLHLENDAWHPVLFSPNNVLMLIGCVMQDVGVTATTWDMYDTYKLVDDLAAKGKYQH